MDAEHSSTFALTPDTAPWYAAIAVFRYLVLGLLRDGTARHGYALMKEYRERSGLQISNGNFYREVQRLVVDGLVRTAANPPDADPRRAPYEITDGGALAFDEWMSDGGSPTIGNYEDEVSARVLFLVDAAPGVALQIIDRWQEELWIRSKMLERAREAILRTNHGATPRRLAALPLLLTRRLKHVTADLDFLEALKGAHEQWIAGPSGGRAKTRSAQSARGPRRPLRRPGDTPGR